VRRLREVPAGVLVEDLLVRLDQGAQVLGAERRVHGDPGGSFDRLQLGGEQLVGHAEHGPAEHLHQPAVGVPGEAIVAALRGEAVHGGVGQPDVQDGLHHAGHREPGTGPYGEQQRVVPVAEPLAQPRLHAPEVAVDLVEHPGRRCAVGEVGAAGDGGDGETGRHRQTEPGHLRQVGALAAEQVGEFAVTFDEVVDEFRHGARLLHWSANLSPSVVAVGGAGGAGPVGPPPRA